MAYDQPFIAQPENAIASYDWNQFGTDTGMKLFYLAKTYDDEILTENQVYSHTIDATAVSSSPPQETYQQLWDTDFDLTAFKTPQVIRGTAYINGTFRVYTLGTGTSGTGKLTFKLRKWNATTSTETEIASIDYELYCAANTNVTKIYLLTIAITNPEHFGVGDSLRLTVLGYYKKNAAGTGGGTGTIYYAFDPMNRDGSYIVPSTDVPETISQLKLWIPFKLNLK
jgi:hypothetical protein